MKFEVGDRVRAVKDLCFARKGEVGTIKKDYIVKWDSYIESVWRDKELNIKSGHGEYVSPVDNSGQNNLELFNGTYELHIICKDGITTNCVCKKNGKIVNRSQTKRNVKYDEFDFKIAVDNCVDRVFAENNVETTKGLVGKHVKLKNLPEKYYPGHVCVYDYGGQCGIVERVDWVLNDSEFTINFDKEYMNAIDNENGKLIFTPDLVEVIE